MQKCLKIHHQLNITKITKKDYKKSFAKNIKVFSNKKKKKSEQYGREQYKSFSEDEKQKLVEYRTKYYKIWKKKNALQRKLADLMFLNIQNTSKRSFNFFHKYKNLFFFR